MGQNVSSYPRFRFVIIPQLPAMVYFEVTASGLISQTMNETVAKVLGSVPGMLQKECFPDTVFSPFDAFKNASFVILDENYSLAAFTTYTQETINNQLHYVAWNVCTAQRYRGKGIIPKLLLFSIEYLKSLNVPDIQYVSLYVLKDNVTAQKVYAKIGFQYDASYSDSAMYRATRPLEYISPQLSPEAQIPLPAEQKEALRVQILTPEQEAEQSENFRVEYANALRKFSSVQSANDLAKRDQELASIREKYRNLSSSVMDSIISGIMLAESTFQLESERIILSDNNLEEWGSGDAAEERKRAELEMQLETEQKQAQLNRSPRERLQDRFESEYYNSAKNLYDALTNPRITIDEYADLKESLNKVEEKYVRQITPEEMKKSINNVQIKIEDNPRYSEDWEQINRTRTSFENEFMQTERDPQAGLNISLASTRREPVRFTTFIGGLEQQLVGFAYLAGKHKDTCCVYQVKEQLRVFEDYAKFMILVQCDGRGNWTINGPTDLGAQMSSCKNPFFLIPLEIINPTRTEGHQNLLICDIQAQTIERFEPHGIASYGISQSLCYNTEKVDEVVKKWIDESAGGNVIYVPPIDYCPNYQTEEEKEPGRLATDPGGFCVAWSLWYADVRLGSPNNSRKEVIDKTLQYLANLGSLKSFIRNYADYVEKILTTIRAIVNQSSAPITVQEWIIGHWHDIYRQLNLK